MRGLPSADLVRGLSWRPLDENRDAAADLLRAAEREARRAGRNVEAESLTSHRNDIREGKAPGGVLRDPSGRVWAVAVWTSIGNLGRRVSPVYLAKELQNPAGWTRFLTALLDSPDPSGRVLLFQASTPGLSEPEAVILLGPRGFHPFHRFGLAFPAGSPLPAAPSRSLEGGRLRALSPADLDSLALLNSACYANSIERFIFATAEDPLEAGRQVFRSLFEGRYGRFLSEASFGLELDGTLRGTTFVTRRPTHKLLADVEVHPSVQGQGHARRLIRATLEAVSLDPTVPLVLAVTQENGVAFQLYRKLGFVVQEGPFTFWANPTALGLSPTSSSSGDTGPRAH